MSTREFREDGAMINPDMIHSVKEIASGWHVVRCGLPVDDVVHDSRDQASDRARYLNSVEEQYYPVLARVAQIVDALRRGQGVGRAEAQNLVQRALQNVREGSDSDLAAISSGRQSAAVR
jgi:hypothetical protein